jgi:hypothetical protein
VTSRNEGRLQAANAFSRMVKMYTKQANLKNEYIRKELEVESIMQNVITIERTGNYT